MGGRRGGGAPGQMPAPALRFSMRPHTALHATLHFHPSFNSACRYFRIMRYRLTRRRGERRLRRSAGFCAPRGTAGCPGACVLGLAGQEPECCVRLPPPPSRQLCAAVEDIETPLVGEDPVANAGFHTQKCTASRLSPCQLGHSNGDRQSGRVDVYGRRCMRPSPARDGRADKGSCGVAHQRTVMNKIPLRQGREPHIEALWEIRFSSENASVADLMPGMIFKALSASMANS
jgi:hypothetical protein